MKITIVTGPWLPVPALRGGAMQKSWHGLARELVGLGHEVTLVARSFPGQPTTEVVDGLRFLRPRGYEQSGSLARDLVKDLAYAVNALRRLPPADILVTNDFWLPALAARLRRSAGAVVVSAARFPKGQYRLYRGAARIVAISSAVRDAIVTEQPALAGRTVVVPLPVDLERFRIRAENEAGGNRTLLYCGRIHPEKGVELLLRVFARLAEGFPRWRLRLVGPTLEAEGGGGDSFARRLRALSPGRAVDWQGPIWDPLELAASYAAADLFCYPSLAEHGEAFGVAALEAMAAGVPPVVSGLACFRDFVRHGENGWSFDHRSERVEEELGEALALAMRDEPLRRRCGAAARATAEAFGYPAIARRLIGELEQAMAAR